MIEFGGNSLGLFITFIVLGVIIGLPGAFLMWKSGREPPQTIPYVVSLIWRRVVMPEIDIWLDWFACITYFAEGLIFEGTFILVVLCLGTIAVSLMSISYVTDTKLYKELPLLTERHGHDPTGQMCWSCFSGLGQCGPIFLGSRVLMAWREITVEPRFRLPQKRPTTQAQVETFVKLVADMKNNVQFQSMYIGGPQLVIQFFFLVKQWDSLTTSLGAWSVVALMKVISPLTSALGLIAMQVDFLCENDRFVQRIWKNDAALVMLCCLFDLGAQVTRLHPVPSPRAITLGLTPLPRPRACVHTRPSPSPQPQPSPRFPTLTPHPLCPVCPAAEQLVMRVVPLVMLIVHNVYAGVVAVALGIVWAVIVTLRSTDHTDADSTSCDACTEAFIVPFLFFPHAFFFAMAFYPGHSDEVPSEYLLSNF